MTKDTGGIERDEYLKVAQGRRQQTPRTTTMRQQWNNNGEASEQGPDKITSSSRPSLPERAEVIYLMKVTESRVSLTS